MLSSLPVYSDWIIHCQCRISCISRFCLPELIFVHQILQLLSDILCRPPPSVSHWAAADDSLVCCLCHWLTLSLGNGSLSGHPGNEPQRRKRETSLELEHWRLQTVSGFWSSAALRSTLEMLKPFAWRRRVSSSKFFFCESHRQDSHQSHHISHPF